MTAHARQPCLFPNCYSSSANIWCITQCLWIIHIYFRQISGKSVEKYCQHSVLRHVVIKIYIKREQAAQLFVNRMCVESAVNSSSSYTYSTVTNPHISLGYPRLSRPPIYNCMANYHENSKWTCSSCNTQSLRTVDQAYTSREADPTG